MPPKKRIFRTSLPPAEIAVCNRLRVIREHLKLSQAQVATQLGITRERLASYEDARAPIKCGFALEFCRRLVVSEEWLALGEEEALKQQAKYLYHGRKPASDLKWRSSDRRLCMSLILEPIAECQRPGSLFTEAYQTFLATDYQKLRSEHDFPRMRFVREGEDELIWNWFHALMELWRARVDPVGAYRLLNSLSIAAQTMLHDISVGDLTEQESEQLLDEAFSAGKISKKDIVDWAKRTKFVVKHTAEFLQRFSEAGAVEKESGEK